MAIGPELVGAVSIEVSGEFRNNKIRRVDFGDLWLALSFSRERTIFFSWDPEFYGVCEARSDEVRRLSEAALGRPPVGMAVKSHLMGAELVRAFAPRRDRVLWIELRRTVGAGFFQTRRLLIEASGRYSNMLLLDDGERIIEAARHIYPEDNRYRSLLPGFRYEPPPPIDGTDLMEWDCDAEDSLDVLPRLIGLGRPLLAAVSRTCSESPGEERRILGGVNFFKDWDGAAVYQSIGNYVTMFPSLLTGAEALPASSALDAARSAVILPLIGRHVVRYRKKISQRLNRLASANAKKISEYETLLSDTGAAERLMSAGRLILANCHAIPPRSSEAELVEWTESGDVRRVIPLNPEFDAARNAEAYFAKYRKKRSASDRAREVLQPLYAERDELFEQAALLECHDDITTLSLMLDELQPSGISRRSGKKPAGSSVPPPHRRYDIAGAGSVIFCGLSSRGNQYVTYRLARGDDLWFHAQGLPGAHVILRLGSKLDPGMMERILTAAASCAAYHSKGRDSGRVSVDHTLRRYVRAIPGGSPSHVTYRDYRTINVDPASWPRALESLGDIR
ncbi:MAG: NFACT family protein [Synergistaceae bacterium]|jgi:predicted ribosome quality control (RQC) complex YloA/Tae2 family protein|nr:NFACT family protein [Synergistaceae bacterium]